MNREAIKEIEFLQGRYEHWFKEATKARAEVETLKNGTVTLRGRYERERERSKTAEAEITNLMKAINKTIEWLDTEDLTDSEVWKEIREHLIDALNN